MSDKKISIVTCFSYEGNQKYVFNPKYLRSDLRRIISFTHNRIGCKLKNIYIITDIHPVKKIQDEILEDFCDEVIKYVNELGLFYGSYDRLHIKESDKMNPLQWVKNLCQQISKKPDILYHKIINTILPVIRSSNVIEFVSLFTNFIIINGKSHFDQTLEKIFSQPMSHLFFYYTGHGVRVWSSRNGIRNYDICLVVPCARLNSEANTVTEFYNRQDLQKKFQLVFNKATSFIVFDCCHAQSIIEFPYRLTFTEEIKTLPTNDLQLSQNSHVYLSSTCNNQTCGFYADRYGGSLFTYYLIKFLDNAGYLLSKGCRRLILNLSGLRQVENQVQNYRQLAKKKPQNMSIGLSQNNITCLPLWLFESNVDRVVEQDD